MLFWGGQKQHKKLDKVSTCMNVNMTIGGVDCNAQVLENELTCRIPKGLAIPASGLPVQVSNTEADQ